MASPITTLGVATIAPATSATSPNVEMVASTQAQPTQKSQPTTPATTTTSQQLQKDTVDLSPTALDMSKELTQKKENEKKQPALYDTQLKNKLSEPVIQKPTDKADISVTKSFPPFMGNSEELKLIKSQAPALYRQILRMIVPPPANISYSDAQLLQRPTIDARM